METQLTLFDYQQLDTETRIVVQQRTGEIKALMKRTAQDIIEIGAKLREVKQRLGYRAYGKWLEIEFGWTERTAERFINVSEKFELSDNLSVFAPSALYLLAAPSTPNDARQEAIERASNGETITYSTAKEIVTEWKKPTRLEYEAQQQRHYIETQQQLYGQSPYEQHLDAALDDQDKPVCQDCGQVYDGLRCPDCFSSLRYQYGDVAYCKYCYQAHGDWSLEDEDRWICDRCQHATQDTYMSIRGKDDTPEAQSFNYKRDAKANRLGDIYTPMGYDACQTPPEALDPLLSYIPDSIKVVWEPAAGEGYLVEALYDGSFDVVQSDLLTGQNFFEYQPDSWDCLVTNPPYSIKYDWLRRCYELGRPFALLMPVEMLGAKTAQEMFSQYGVEVIFMDKRVNFKMPNKGWDGGGAQFPVAWFTWGLNIGHQMTFAKVGSNDKTG